jgi:hypothetical protein
VNRQAVNQLFTVGEYPSFARQGCRQLYFSLALDFVKEGHLEFWSGEVVDNRTKLEERSFVADLHVTSGDTIRG